MKYNAPTPHPKQLARQRRRLIIWGIALLVGLAVVGYDSYRTPEAAFEQNSTYQLTERKPTVTHTAEEIHALAAEDANIKLTNHAILRMEQRHFTQEEVKLLLRNGTIAEPPEAGKFGGIRYKLQYTLPKKKLCTTIIAISPQNRVVVITVYDNEKEPSK